MRAIVDLASKLCAASLPMLLSNLVLEALLALVALKVGVVELLHDEAVDVLAEVDVAPAVRASVITLLPLGDALGAAKLVAVRALFWVFNDLQADRAREVAVDTGASLFGR